MKSLHFSTFLIFVALFSFAESELNLTSTEHKCVRYEDDEAKFSALEYTVPIYLTTPKEFPDKFDDPISLKGFGEIHGLSYIVRGPVGIGNGDVKFSRNYTYEADLSFSFSVKGRYLWGYFIDVPFNIRANISVHAGGKFCIPDIFYEDDGPSIDQNSYLLHASLDRAFIKESSIILSGTTATGLCKNTPERRIVPSLDGFYLPLAGIFYIPVAIFASWKFSHGALGFSFYIAVFVAFFASLIHVLYGDFSGLVLVTFISILYTWYKDNLGSVYDVKSLFYDPSVHSSPKQSKVKLQYFDRVKLEKSNSIKA